MKNNQLLSTEAQALLSVVMASVGMPDELDGSSQQTRQLIEQFSPDLAPHDPLWDQFAKVVTLAFPNKEFQQTDNNAVLKKQIHQFRYVISSQQAQWVRKHYRTSELSDEEALAAYIAQESILYSARDSSRLHNKGKYKEDKKSFEKSRMLYPDGSDRDVLKDYSQINYKVLIGEKKHTEFIIDQDGNFLNELEIENSTENGIVNGASFNYANSSPTRDKSAIKTDHWDYDVDTVEPWDPEFRKTLNKIYLSPNNLVIGGQEFFKDGNWLESYWNSDGYYSEHTEYGDVSKQDLVRAAAKAFERLVNDYE